MDTLKFKIPLEVHFRHPVMVDDELVNRANMDEIDFQSISQQDIEKLDGQYDWIDTWRNSDYDKKMAGFNNKDVKMEVTYNNGNYMVTLVSDKSFTTIVRNNRYYTSSPKDFKDIPLKEAVVNFIEGGISDGIGENPIGRITYQEESCDVWLGDLKEI